MKSPKEVRVAIASPPVPVSPVTQLRGAVDALVAVDPAELSDAALASWLLATRAEMDRQDAVFARPARAAHTRGVGALDGAASTAAWLRSRARMREGDARAAIEAGEVSELLAETGEAWRAGDVSSTAVRMITAARVDGFDDEYVGCEDEFLDLARRHDLRRLRLATAHFRRIALADGTEPSVHDGLHVSRLIDGRTVIKGELSDLAAETVTTALHAYTDPPDDQFPKTTSRRYAEALVRICEVALAETGTKERARAQVSIVVDWKTLTDRQPGRLDGAFTGPLHPRDIERLLCDCRHQPHRHRPRRAPARRRPRAAQPHPRDATSAGRARRRLPLARLRPARRVLRCPPCGPLVAEWRDQADEPPPALLSPPSRDPQAGLVHHLRRNHVDVHRPDGTGFQ